MAGEKYDSTYKKGVFFGKRSAAITQILKYVKVPGRALDLGVGQGRTFVPLLKEGFSGVGVDESSVGIKDFLKYAQEEGVDCEGVCCDIVEYKFKEDFDIIISMFTLQFLDGFD
ncbi:MAG: 2-polyprenyl-3-methyl-5-hydroxy-6-metoxy-1,4-benzoquinol methylase, partial [Patescibacteria group bacterium]